MKPRTCRLLLTIALLCGADPQAALTHELDLDVPAKIPTRFEIPSDLVTKLGRRIWLNESGGNEQAITAWNIGEDFMSLGIGHFIWLPAGRASRFEESFPRMLDFLRAKGVRLPAWLDQHPIPPCPWRSKPDFEKGLDSPQMTELRAFLRNTMDAQAQFLILRAQRALPKILSTISSADIKERVQRQFDRVARASTALYPIVDYVNFKGEGVSPSETFPNMQSGAPEGWGLKQVLMTMTGITEGQPALDEFANAAKQILRKRIQNNPADAVSERGWFIRCDTYRQLSL